MLPNYLTEIFTSTNSIHDYNTRNSEFNFALPYLNTNSMKKSFAYSGAEAWNNLSKTLTKFNQFNSIFIIKHLIVKRILFPQIAKANLRWEKYIYTVFAIFNN